MKVTVGDLKAAGFKLVVGDALAYDTDGNIERYVVESVTVGVWNKNDNADFDWTVESLIPRPNLGTQPVADDCVVEVTGNNGNIYVAQAINAPWFKTVDKSQNGAVYAVVSWKPSLKHLERQMNKESAMNIIERDIENAVIKQEDADVERELSESDEWVNGLPPVGSVCEIKHQQATSEWANPGFYEAKILAYDNELIIIESHGRESCGDICDYIFRKPLTPEQLAAKERELAAIELHDKANTIYFGGELPLNCGWDAVTDNVKAMWLAVVDMTGYRK